MSKEAIVPDPVSQPHERYAASNAALVVVDVQNDFMSAEGEFGRRGADMSAQGAIMPKLHELIAGARTADVPVVFIRTEHDDRVDADAWVYRVGPDWQRKFTVVRADSWGAQFFEVEPLPDEIVLTKYRYSSFVGTPLAQLLRSWGVKSVLFAGTLTDVCVESSARDAVNQDFYASMIADCCATTSREAHEASLRVFGRHFGTIVDGDELLDAWSRRPRTINP